VTTYGTPPPPPPRAAPQLRHLARFTPVLVVVLALIAAMVSPGIRTVLRESFTRMPAEYTELYFSGEPRLSGTGAKARIAVPVGLLHHGAAGATFVIRAQVSTPDGATGPATETSLATEPERPGSAVLTVTVPATATAYDVNVTLPGHPQTLHYQLKS
jgi:hypothetical protein